MQRWFDRLPIHRKLVTLALAVTSAALLLTTIGLIAADLWQYRRSAAADTDTLAEVLAEHTAAAVRFEQPEAAAESLESVRVRPAIRRACIYLPDGSLFAGFARAADLGCPRSHVAADDWFIVGATAPIVRDSRTIGIVALERDLAELAQRIMLSGSFGLAMLLLAGALAATLAHRLNKTVSMPISQLAVAARRIEQQADGTVLPRIVRSDDEVGELVRAFDAMVRRLLESNDQLQREVDERRRVEAERQVLLDRERETSRLKDEFLAAVSHELRTPLNAILGWVQILGTTAVDEQLTARAIASISKNARLQTRVIEDLVDVSRIVTGKLQLRLEPTDLRTVIEAAVDVVKPAADARGVRVEVNLPPETISVTGDPDRLRQVIWNLLSNAVKFTPAGGTVHVMMSRTDRGVRVEVQDTGIGIRKEFLPHVFDRFRQADGSMTREHGGLGLGLSIVKDLVDAHGGSVEVFSAGEGLGTTFQVHLLDQAVAREAISR